MKKFTLRTIFSGLSRQVLLWFLFISLLPLSIVSWISYQSGEEQLRQSTVQTLIDVSSIQTRFIRTNFDRITVELSHEVEQKGIVSFLETLIDAYQDSGMASASEFVSSDVWEELVVDHISDLESFWKAYGHHDIFLIDKEGNILFTFAEESDLGANLFKGDLSDTRFAATAKKSLNTGEMLFSDLERYAPSNNMLAGFILSPIVNNFSERVGLMAFQLSDEKLMELVQRDNKFGKSGRRYLIGTDLTLRSPGVLGEQYPVLERKIDTEQSNDWIEHIAIHGSDETEIEEPFVYQGPNGEEVLGMHTNINIAGIQWSYISEIDTDEAFEAADKLAYLTLFFMGATMLVVLLIAIPVTRSIVRPIVEISGSLAKVGKGELQPLTVHAGHELGALVSGFNSMIEELQDSEQDAQSQRWLQDGSSRLKDQMQGDHTATELAHDAIGFLCRYLGAQIGAFYIVNEKKIELMGSYALHAHEDFHNEFEMGEGLVGQAALDQQMITLSDVPSDYLAITSGLGETIPKVITVIPLIWNSNVVALLEFGTSKPFRALDEKLLEMASSSIVVSVQSSLTRDRTQALLEQTQVQAEELQAREEELRENNNLLEHQAQDLKKSEEMLRSNHAQLEERNEQMQVQQEELRVANEELEEKAHDLQVSRDMVESKNLDLGKISVELEKRAEEIAEASRYKSEFLANMSHELRTPLNSLLILSKLLADDRDKNLSEKQVEYACTIYDAGSDLLNLINEILDLSKIESGKMEIHVEPIYRDDFIVGFENKFRPMAQHKGIDFEIETDRAPEKWRSDGQKLGQIIKNLLSNAIKFTEKGKVILRIEDAAANIHLSTPGLTAENSLAFSVIDSGIGISDDKRNAIFEAFQQADGTTSRKYGGTGLGLSISRELAKLLGGEIQIESEHGKGSTFTLYIPRELTSSVSVNENIDNQSMLVSDAVSESEAKDSIEESTPDIAEDSTTTESPVVTAQPSDVSDDRNNLKRGERSILIIEDDARFASILAETARERGFKVLIAEDGKTGLYFAEYYLPSGIVLDIGLPAMDGWQVMEHLKDNAKTRHIPVHFMSAHDSSLDAMKNGAIGFLTKPVSMDAMQQAFGRIEDIISRPVKRLLLVEDDQIQSNSLRELIGNGDVETVTAASGEEAEKQLLNSKFDCIVLDLGLPDMSGIDLLETIRSQNDLQQIPVVVYTGKELEPKERAVLDRYAQSIIIKSVRSPEMLLDDTTLFLHRVEEKLPEERRRMIRMLHDREAVFEGRKVLLVDDDMRNIFALSAILQEKDMQVLTAKNGCEALERLEAEPGTAIVLMDIMMPEMDGYEATRRIREQKRFAKLPIIALTAKAMKGDRALCIEAGASDYLTKPVNTEKLLSMMRVWLYQ